MSNDRDHCQIAPEKQAHDESAKTAGVPSIVNEINRRGIAEILDRALHSAEAYAVERSSEPYGEPTTISVDGIASGYRNGMPGPWRWQNWLDRLYPAPPADQPHPDKLRD